VLRIKSWFSSDAIGFGRRPSAKADKKFKNIKNIWHYYGIKNRFKILKMPYLIWIDSNTIRHNSLRFFLRRTLFAIFFIFHSIIKKPEVYYVRDVFWASYLSSLKFLHRGKVYYEGHKSQPLVAKLIKRGKIDGLIVTTNQLKNYYLARGVPKERLFVAANGVDLKMFKKLPSKTAIKKELKIPLDKKVICYTGHLYEWKGVQVLALAMRDFKDDFICYFVGGLEKDISRFKNFIKKNNIRNCIIVGHVPPTLVPKYQIAADVLVLPNIKKGDSGYTSPLKLYEYMASKRPIVASDLPSLREVLTEKNSILIEPNNPGALSRGIKLVLNDKKLAEKLSKNAYHTVKKYDWSERAKNIIRFIENK
jgi:glycosyltransferase involved in cell wall biosynthesis